MAKWKDVIGAVAPKIGAALGSPLGGLAVSVLAEKLGLSSEASEKDIAKALASMSPADYTKLKEAEYDYEKRCAELEVDLEEIHAKDRASARDRQIKTGDKTPNILAYIIIVGFFACFFTLFFYGSEVEGGVKDVLLAMVGLLGGLTAGVIAYFFGSSRGSKDKTDLLDRAMGKVRGA